MHIKAEGIDIFHIFLENSVNFLISTIMCLYFFLFKPILEFRGQNSEGNENKKVCLSNSLTKTYNSRFDLKLTNTRSDPCLALSFILFRKSMAKGTAGICTIYNNTFCTKTLDSRGDCMSRGSQRFRLKYFWSCFLGCSIIRRLTI